MNASRMLRSLLPRELHVPREKPIYFPTCQALVIKLARNAEPA